MMFAQNQGVAIAAQGEAVAQAAGEAQTATPAPTTGVRTIQTPSGVTITLPGGVSARAMLEAARAKREVVRDLIERAKNRREEIGSQLRNGSVTGADRLGLERRVTEMDARIIDLEAQLKVAEQEMVAAASIPGATGRRVFEDQAGAGRAGPPREMFTVLPAMLVVFVLAPIALAHARRIWRRTSSAAVALPQAMIDRFNRLEQNVDTLAIEVERISEGQRFMTKLFAESGARPGAEETAAALRPAPLR